MKITNPAIPFGSLVVVIGANGYIGFETCLALLEAGYSVRGTVRDVKAHRAWMTTTLNPAQYGQTFEVVQVIDFEADGAFDEAFRGASGVIYVSTPIIISTNKEMVFHRMLTGTTNTLVAAARAGVKRYVLSSSSKAVESVVYGRPHELTAETFNYEILHKVEQGALPEDAETALNLYCAGRTAAELKFWKWLEENEHPFVANCVVPDGNFGRILAAEHDNRGSSSTGGMLKNALQGNWSGVLGHLAYYVDAQDTARLLVAATVMSSLENERIFAYYHQGTWNDLRHKVRELYPRRPELVRGQDLKVAGRDLSRAPKPIARAENILRELGLPGFMSQEDILQGFVESAFPSENTGSSI